LSGVHDVDFRSGAPVPTAVSFSRSSIFPTRFVGSCYWELHSVWFTAQCCAA